MAEGRGPPRASRLEAAPTVGKRNGFSGGVSKPSCKSGGAVTRAPVLQVTETGNTESETVDASLPPRFERSLAKSFRGFWKTVGGLP